MNTIKEVGATLHYCAGIIVLMDEILHHLGALNYCSSLDFRDLRWRKISCINSSAKSSGL